MNNLKKKKAKYCEQSKKKPKTVNNPIKKLKTEHFKSPVQEIKATVWIKMKPSQTPCVKYDAVKQSSMTGLNGMLSRF